MRLHDDVLRTRLLPVPETWERTTLRLAAVLLPLFERTGEDHVLFTVRPDHLPAHPGQISFPGGAREGDEGPLSCALRECSEELGLEVEAITVLGGLPSRQSSSGFRVHPLVGRIPDPASLRPDPAEVARLLAVPLAQLRVESAWEDRQPPPDATGRRPPPSPHFASGSDVVWGLTGRIAWDFVIALHGM
jgi:8-oxo-dGTP pyrophosphatase MutT (NUDIX family)